MKTAELLTSLMDGYDEIEAENRITVVHFLRQDKDGLDISPPMTFDSGITLAHLSGALAHIGKREEMIGVIALQDAWTYPEDVVTRVSAMPREQAEAFWRKTPPSMHPDRQSLSVLMCMFKDGEKWLLTKLRGEKAQFYAPDDPMVVEVNGRQFDAAKEVLGLA